MPVPSGVVGRKKGKATPPSPRLRVREARAVAVAAAGASVGGVAAAAVALAATDRILAQDSVRCVNRVSPSRADRAARRGPW
jgi:hypothetical protein